MKIYNRFISFSSFSGQTLAFLKILSRISLFKHPWKMLGCYIKKESSSVIELKSGLKIKLSSHSDDIVTFFLVFLKQDYGKIKTNSTVIDIGANIGMFAIYAAVSGAKKVYAFEPSKEAFDVLCKNIKSNNLEDIIIPTNKAVCANNGDTIKFLVSSSPYNRIDNYDGVFDENFYEVQTISLSSIISINNLSRIDILKIDCEGAEFEIFPSISKSELAKISKIRMEIHGKPEPLLADLTEKGYVIDRIFGSNIWLTNKSC